MNRTRMRLPLAALGWLLIVGPASGAATPPETSESPSPSFLATAVVHDAEAIGRLFDRGVPVTDESFSPDGFHFAYLHHVPGGFLSRKPRRCTYILDLGTGLARPLPTPDGRAARIGGWDPTGRYLLIESHQPDFLSSLTGSWTTYHFVFDVVTSDFVTRKPFTGRRDDRRFRWKRRHTYHGGWAEGEPATVWPLYDGELAELHQERERALADEDERRRVTAESVAVGSGGKPDRPLGAVLARLDDHWTQRGQSDPVVSELFGERPALFALRGDEWIEVCHEVEHVSVLDHDLLLLTGEGGAQTVFNRGRWEMLQIPPPPEGWAELLQTRWNRTGGFYVETDPLPRDLQYRRTFDSTQGIGYYSNYLAPGLRDLFILYSFGPERRVLRIVELPESWHIPID